jgi:uncharacterized membrane protein YfcA
MGRGREPGHLSGVIKLAILVVVGRLGRSELAATAFLVPATVAGLFASRWLVRYLDARRIRSFVLVLTAADRPCTRMAR